MAISHAGSTANRRIRTHEANSRWCSVRPLQNHRLRPPRKRPAENLQRSRWSHASHLRRSWRESAPADDRCGTSRSRFRRTSRFEASISVRRPSCEVRCRVTLGHPAAVLVAGRRSPVRPTPRLCPESVPVLPHRRTGTLSGFGPVGSARRAGPSSQGPGASVETPLCRRIVNHCRVFAGSPARIQFRRPWRPHGDHPCEVQNGRPPTRSHLDTNFLPVLP